MNAVHAQLNGRQRSLCKSGVHACVQCHEGRRGLTEMASVARFVHHTIPTSCNPRVLNATAIPIRWASWQLSWCVCEFLASAWSQDRTCTLAAGTIIPLDHAASCLLLKNHSLHICCMLKTRHQHPWILSLSKDNPTLLRLLGY